jgi:putative endonuclease
MAGIMFYIYILQSTSTGETYTGQTSNLENRLQQHNDPSYTKTLHTKRRKGPWVLIYKEEFSTRAEAMRREKYLKTGKGREWVKNNILN